MISKFCVTTNDVVWDGVRVRLLDTYHALTWRVMNK